MGKKNLGEKIHYVPLLGPVEKTATFSTGGINMGLFNQVEFIVQLGAVAANDLLLTVEECTATGGTSADAIAFEYRKSAAAGTDTMGAVTAVTTPATGFPIVTGDAGKTVIVTVDSSDLTDTHKYVRLTVTDTGTGDAFMGIVAVCHPRYEQATPTAALT